MKRLARIVLLLPLLVFSPLAIAISALSLAVSDLLFRLFGRARLSPDRRPRSGAASVVIPNWNGRELLAKYLPSVEAALAGNPENEIVVVENGSTDGSAAFLGERFPRVRVIALDRNLGFGGGSNAGFRAARNDIVVLLNSDMRVEPDFLAPLLEAFTDEKVFAVSCQIFMAAPDRRREETGLTQAWWEDGGLKVTHREDPAIADAYPCFYGGGGSCAFDRKKFLELGGFDPLYEPFYLEDTDLGFMAWKRGWKVLYQPKSKVHHEHRGTIGRRFSEERIQAVLKKNHILFCWKNIHQWRRLASHFVFLYSGALVSLAFGNAPGRPNLMALWRACASLPRALAARRRARSLAAIDDTEAFERPLGACFRDRFHALGDSSKLRVLFVSPYPICPPTHGGGVFMYQTLRELARLAEVHVVALLDFEHQIEMHRELDDFCASTNYLIRMPGKASYPGSVVPHAAREFENPDLAWLIHRLVYTRRIDVIQLEYTPLAQYAMRFERLASVLFEHDIYFQSIARGMEYMPGPLKRLQARFEYLRALRYEIRMLPRFDSVQVCTRENKEYLKSFAPRLAPILEDGLRAGIDTAGYEFKPDGREPDTMLFLGSFRHAPNQVALDWFVRRVLPEILKRRPEAKLVVVGSDPPPAHIYEEWASAIEFAGFVEDVREPLARCAIFVCPVLSGSGVRVKLLEAFAAGIPVVSTRIGAEGLARVDGECCRLADSPAQFAEQAAALLANPDQAAELARRARREVEENWDMAKLTRRLEASFRRILADKNGLARAATASRRSSS